MELFSTPWWTALLAADMHLELHTDVGRVGALLPLVPSEIAVVLDHFAKPERIDGRDETVRVVCQRNHSGSATYVTLSGPYRQASENRLRACELATLWRDELGVYQLLWGSDWPCTNFEGHADYAALHGALTNWLPSADDCLAVLSVNANRLYWR